MSSRNRDKFWTKFPAKARIDRPQYTQLVEFQEKSVYLTILQKRLVFTRKTQLSSRLGSSQTDFCTLRECPVGQWKVTWGRGQILVECTIETPSPPGSCPLKLVTPPIAATNLKCPHHFEKRPRREIH